MHHVQMFVPCSAFSNTTHKRLSETSHSRRSPLLTSCCCDALRVRRFSRSTMTPAGNPDAGYPPCLAKRVSRRALYAAYEYGGARPCRIEASCWSEKAFAAALTSAVDSLIFAESSCDEDRPLGAVGGGIRVVTGRSAPLNSWRRRSARVSGVSEADFDFYMIIAIA